MYVKKYKSDKTTDLDWKSETAHTALYNGVITMELQLGYLGLQTLHVAMRANKERPRSFPKYVR